MEFRCFIMMHLLIHVELVTVTLCKHLGCKSQNNKCSHDPPHFNSIHEGMDSYVINLIFKQKGPRF